MTTKKESIRGLEGVKSSRKIGNNTFEVIYNDGSRAIRLHYTDVITFNNDGSIFLNTNGWQTVTSKARINEYLPDEYYIYQKDYTWYIAKRSYDGDKWVDLQIEKYFDGIMISNKGIINE